jgi:hypothetical protein
MNENDNVTSISRARSLEEIADFWDTHSLADYWDQTTEVEFEVRAQRRRRVTLDPDLYAQIETQAHQRGVMPETLVNLWLAERLRGGGGIQSPQSVFEDRGLVVRNRLRKRIRTAKSVRGTLRGPPHPAPVQPSSRAATESRPYSDCGLLRLEDIRSRLRWHPFDPRSSIFDLR